MNNGTTPGPWPSRISTAIAVVLLGFAPLVGLVYVVAAYGHWLVRAAAAGWSVGG